MDDARRQIWARDQSGGILGLRGTPEGVQETGGSICRRVGKKDVEKRVE